MRCKLGLIGLFVCLFCCHLFIAAEDGPRRLGAQVVGDLVDDDAVLGQNGLDRHRVASLNG